MDTSPWFRSKTPRPSSTSSRSTRTRTARAGRRRGPRAVRLVVGLSAALLTIAAATVPAAGATSTAPSAGATSTAAASSTPTPAGSAAAGTSTAAVTVSLVSMTPRLPEPDPSPQKVTFQATITNNTSVAYSDIQLELARGEPITSQSGLDKAIATPPPTTDLTPVWTDTKQALPAHARLTVTYVTSPDSQHMCLCYANSVFPFALVAGSPPSAGATPVELGRTQILVPSFQTKPAGLEVSWLWPLIDRPHRGLSATEFTDDDLATSVAPGGRLYRALQVAEAATQTGVRLTLMVDPELLDSLYVMTKGYTYLQGKTVVTGTGGVAAQDWLTRFVALRAQDDVVLTAYADPDIDATTRAGIGYSTALEPSVQSDLRGILGQDLSSELAWPVDGVMTTKALNAAVSAGAATVLLSDQALPGQNSAEPKPDAVSTAPAATGQATALVTDTPIEKTIADAFAHPADAANDEQTLLSQLAIRAVQDPTDTHFVVMTPDRYVDADPAVAAQLITAVSANAWTTPILAQQAVDTVHPVDRGPLVTPPGAQAQELPGGVLAALTAVTAEVASLRAALSPADALTLLGGFDDAVLRGESASWRADPNAALGFATGLSNRVSSLTNAIHLVQPTNGTYTLSSQNSPVVVTVENDLAVPVTVRISVAPTQGVLGFRASTIQRAMIAGHTKATIQIPAHVDRLGKFKVVATLVTPGGTALGPSVPLTLRVTAIGGITKAITGVAIVVLVLALLRRLIRRVRGKGPGRGAVSARHTPATT